jgi:hypothetical protein
LDGGVEEKAGLYLVFALNIEMTEV